MIIKKGNLYFPDSIVKKKAILKQKSIYKKAGLDPIKFWEKLAKKVFWFRAWEKTFVHNPYSQASLKKDRQGEALNRPPYFQWFAGGKINITSNIFEKNSSGFEKIKDKTAFIWEPEPKDEKQQFFTYEQLFQAVNRFANALKKLGVKKGERVGIYLPMIPEVIISILACARIGAVHSVVFSAFSPNALKIRLQNVEAKVLITADGYYRRGKIIDLKQSVDAALLGREGVKETEVEKVIVVKRAKNQISWQEGRDLWWQDLIASENDFCEPEIMDSEDSLFILFTSGSTGKPKGCEHVVGGYTVQSYWTGKWIFDWKETDIFWSTADIGWITGHTYSCYAPLLNGITFIIFEGALDWPMVDRWAEIIEKYDVTVFYTAPTAIRMFEKNWPEILKKPSARADLGSGLLPHRPALEKSQCGGAGEGYKFKSLRLLGSVGEPIDEAAWQWYFKEIGKEKCLIVDTWWQTETGGILISSLPGIGPFKPAFAGLPFPGVKFDIFDEKGNSLAANQEGNLVILSPFAPSLLRGIYKDSEKYFETYWSQYGKKVYFTSDSALKDENGLIRISGRVDDVIKVAGHRLTTGELEAAINLHPEITECAVVGVLDEIKGEAPVVFITYTDTRDSKELQKEVVEQIRKEIGPIASPREVYLVEDLPKTRSGKIMRRILKKMFTGEEFGDLSTLANPQSVGQIQKVIQEARNLELEQGQIKNLKKR